MRLLSVCARQQILPCVLASTHYSVWLQSRTAVCACKHTLQCACKHTMCLQAHTAVCACKRTLQCVLASTHCSACLLQCVLARSRCVVFVIFISHAGMGRHIIEPAPFPPEWGRRLFLKVKACGERLPRSNGGGVPCARVVGKMSARKPAKCGFAGRRFTRPAPTATTIGLGCYTR